MLNARAKLVCWFLIFVVHLFEVRMIHRESGVPIPESPIPITNDQFYSLKWSKVNSKDDGRQNSEVGYIRSRVT